MIQGVERATYRFLGVNYCIIDNVWVSYDICTNVKLTFPKLHFVMYTSIESSKCFISNMREVNSVCVKVSSAFKSRITFKREGFFFQRNQGIAQCCIIVENTSIMFYKKHKWKNIFHQSTNFWKNNEKFNMNVAFILQEYNFLSQILNWRDIKSWVVVIFEKEGKRLHRKTRLRMLFSLLCCHPSISK